jgi:hypothetical protein
MDTTMKMAVFLFVLTLSIVGFARYGHLFYDPGPEPEPSPKNHRADNGYQEKNSGQRAMTRFLSSGLASAVLGNSSFQPHGLHAFTMARLFS